MYTWKDISDKVNTLSSQLLSYVRIVFVFSLCVLSLLVFPLLSVPVQAEITTEVITYPVGAEITLNCQVHSYLSSAVTWYNGEDLVVESEKFKIVGQFIMTPSVLYM